MTFKNTFHSGLFLCVFMLLFSCSNTKAARNLSDDSEEVRQNQRIVKYDSYQTALENWTTVNDVSMWMGQHFSYDMSRAIALSETNRKNNSVEIYTPSELFSVKKGICVDLARFGVETLRSLMPQKETKYLMIEFVPIEIDGEIIRKHWLAFYPDGSDYYFFADSKRPGYISGPYKQVEDYISEYSKYRQRKIVSSMELDSYKKKRIKKIKKQENQ